MLGLIWTQTVGHSESVPESFFLWKKVSRQPKNHERLPSMHRVNPTDIFSDVIVS